MKIVKNIISAIVDVVMLFIIIAAAGVTLVSLTSNSDGISKIGKYIPLNVKTNSMEDTIYQGDFIIIEEVDPNALKLGDVISFKAAEQEKIIIKTHRIVDIDRDGGVKFITRGDNNEADDNVPVYTSDVVGIWKGVRLSKVGYILDFVSGRYGFLFFIVLPLFILFIYQIYKFIVVIIEEAQNAAINKSKEMLKKENENSKKENEENKETKKE